MLAHFVRSHGAYAATVAPTARAGYARVRLLRMHRLARYARSRFRSNLRFSRKPSKICDFRGKIAIFCENRDFSTIFCENRRFH